MNTFKNMINNKVFFWFFDPEKFFLKIMALEFHPSS